MTHSELSKINSRASLDRSPNKNWVENAGGLPMYIRRIANHLHQEKGKTIGHSIAIAVNAVRKMCATGDLNWKGKQNVNAKSRAQACAAVASWERKKASARVSKGVVGRKWSDDEFIAFLTNEGEIQKDFNCNCGKKKKKKSRYEVGKRNFTKEQRKKATTYPGTDKFPIENQEDLNNAWKLRGNSDIPKEKVEAYIRSCAKRKGLKVPGESVSKHGTHNQLSHGNWAKGIKALGRMRTDELVSLLYETEATESHGPLSRRKRNASVKAIEEEIRSRYGIKKSSDMSDEEFNEHVLELKKFYQADDEEIDADTIEFDAVAEIEKRDDDKRLVFGWCSIAKHKDGTVEVDKQGDVLDDIDQMEKVAYDFVLHSRDGGEMHVRKGVSTLVESFVSTPEKWEAMEIPEGTLPIGWWVGFKVNDDKVWRDVKIGKYKMFSVHGSGTRKALED